MSRRRPPVYVPLSAAAAVPSSVSPQALALVSGLAGVSFGLLVGYILAIEMGARPAAVQPVAAAAAAPAAPAPAPPALINEQELEAQKRILANDPKNAAAATRLGDMFYDAQRFSEAIPYYEKALKLNPKNANLSTDLGTSLWNVGRADEALAQFAASLAIDPAHANTYFNIGIVKLHGKQDARGAVEAWQKLLETNPSYPNAEKVRTLIANAPLTAQ